MIGETASTKTYRLRPSAWISFLAGQHIEVQLTAADGYRANRFYSIGSTPDAVGTYDITVDRLKHGEVSSWFHEVARPGDTIELRGPFGGHFVWRDTDKGPLLLVAGGSGIVPIMSIIRHRAHVAPDTPAVLLYGARTMDDLIFADELVRREQWEPHFSTVFAFSRGKAQRDTDFSRRIDSEIIGAALARLPSRPALTFVCGSNAFAESVSAMIADSGVPPGTIRVERFGE
ncbi:MAG: FAD-binding oxidoreductase [Hyphomicrobiaceae bacterium]